MESGQVVYYDFVKVILEFCQSAASGCVFFTSDMNHSGRVIIKNGVICSVTYAHKRGNDAIALMPSIKAVRFRFDALAVKVSNDAGLPATGVILRNLAPLHDVLEMAASAPPAAGLSAAQKNIIEQALIEVVGPAGSFLCDDHLADASSLEEGLKSIETELTPEENNSFRQIVSSMLS